MPPAIQCPGAVRRFRANPGDLFRQTPGTRRAQETGELVLPDRRVASGIEQTGRHVPVTCAIPSAETSGAIRGRRCADYPLVREIVHQRDVRAHDLEYGQGRAPMSIGVMTPAATEMGASASCIEAMRSSRNSETKVCNRS